MNERPTFTRKGKVAVGAALTAVGLAAFTYDSVIMPSNDKQPVWVTPDIRNTPSSLTKQPKPNHSETEDKHDCTGWRDTSISQELQGTRGLIIPAEQHRPSVIMITKENTKDSNYVNVAPFSSPESVTVFNNKTKTTSMVITRTPLVIDGTVGQSVTINFCTTDGGLPTVKEAYSRDFPRVDVYDVKTVRADKKDRSKHKEDPKEIIEKGQPIIRIPKPTD